MGCFIDLAGQKFGRLTVVEQQGKSKDGRILWLCICDCGNEKVVSGHDLKNEDTKSCGCLLKEIMSNNKFGKIHGHCTKGKSSRTYRIWRSMLNRCNNKNNIGYKNYGDRKIKVCKRWSNKKNGFQNFLKDMGEIPKGKSLDRINNNGNYSPENCKLSTTKEQNRNMRTNVNYTYNNKTRCRTDWAEEYKMSYQTLGYRLDVLKWPIEKALTTPIRKHKKYRKKPNEKTN